MYLSVLTIFSIFQIYIASKLTKCMRVQTGDRVGVYIEEAPGAIAYTFDGASPDALVHTQTNVTDPQPTAVDDVVEFGSLTFPYDFSVRAYFDTNMTLYDVTEGDFPTCPKGLIIPVQTVITLPPTTPAPPVTGKPGATGGEGRTGIQRERRRHGTAGSYGRTRGRGQDGETRRERRDGSGGDERVGGSNGRARSSRVERP